MQRFEECNNLDGVGFVFHNDDPFVGIDIDDCVADDKFSELAQEILQRFPGSYAEVSPSGTGLKLWLKGKLPISDEPDKKGRLKTGRKIPKLGLETYCRGRYFATTSQMIVDPTSKRHAGDIPVIVDHNNALQKWFAEVFPEGGSADKKDYKPSMPVSAGVMEIIAKWQAGDSCVIIHAETSYNRHTSAANENAILQFMKNDLQKLIRELKQVDTSAEDEPNKKKVNTMLGDRPGWTRDIAKLANISENKSARISKGANTLFAKFPLVEQAANGNAAVNPKESNDTSMIDQIFWLALTCHRRTRISTGLLRLYQDIMPEDYLKPESNNDGLLCWFLKKSHLAENSANSPLAITEGGGIWCDRPWRDAVYDFNTRYTSKQFLHSAKQDSLPGIITQHVIIAVLHDLIARNYYLNVFLPSQDCFAFLEYVYHRISSLRYLAQLSAILQLSASHALHPNGKYDRSEFEALGNFVQHFGEKCGADWKEVFYSMFPKDSQSHTHMPKVEALGSIRERCLRGFAETWRRTEPLLRRELPADQVIIWCKTLLSYDLYRSFDKSTAVLEPGRIDHEHTLRHLEPRRVHPNQKTQNQFSKIKAELQELIADTLGRALYEQGRFEEMCFHRIVTRKLRAEGERKELKRLKFHDELDELVADGWRQFGEGTKLFSGKGMQNSAYAKRFEVLKKRIPPSKRVGKADTSSFSQFVEAQLRVSYLEVELTLMNLSPIGIMPQLAAGRERPARLGEDAKKTILRRVVECQEVAEKAINLAREEYGTTRHQRMRSPLLEQGADRGLFLPYRSLFQMLLGRLTTIKGVLLAQGDDETHTSLQCFRDAFRFFANARSGIDQSNSVVLGIVDIGSVDLALAQADCIYKYEAGKDGLNDLTQLLGRVDAKLRTSSGYLWQAIGHLNSSAKYVLVWRYFHICQCKYHIERLIQNIGLALNSIAERPERRNKPEISEDRIFAAGNLVDRVRKGLAAIRSGLDFTAEDDTRFISEWHHLWSRLGCAAIIAGLIRFCISEPNGFRLVSHPVSQQGNFKVVCKRLIQYWQDLNASEGICVAMQDTHTAKIPKGTKGDEATTRHSEAANWAEVWEQTMVECESQNGQDHQDAKTECLLQKLDYIGKSHMSTAGGSNNAVLISTVRAWILDDYSFRMLYSGESTRFRIS